LARQGRPGSGGRSGLGTAVGRDRLGAAACRRGGVAERASGRDVHDEQRAATKQAGWQQRRGGVAGRRGSSWRSELGRGGSAAALLCVRVPRVKEEREREEREKERSKRVDFKFSQNF